MNSQQAAAVEFDHASDGAVLILAGAGSGKTTVLTRRIAYLLAQGIAADAILALTFTKDAAREMEARVRKLVHAEGEADTAIEAVTEGAMNAIPRIGTFHSFAYGLIRSGIGGKPNWMKLGFKKFPELQDASERRAWLVRCAESAGVEASSDLLEEWISDPLASDDDAAGQSPDRSQSPREIVRERLRNHMLEVGAVSFDDMVPLALRLLKNHADVSAEMRRRLSHILVDEFQDTSPDQLELIGLLAGTRRNLFLVGDDDQAIYGFRGADPGNIGAAGKAFPGLKILKLEINYRSTAEIIRYANLIFRDKPGHLRKRLVAGREKTRAPAVVKQVHRTGLEQAKWMIEEMRLLRKAGMAWSDFAILYRLNVLEPYYRSLLSRLAGPEAAAEVVLSTVHGAKGLEYPVVFFVGLEDGILPYRWREEKLSPGKLAEEKRIFYVGVTRAERYLYLCACRRRTVKGKVRDAAVSPFLGIREPGLASRMLQIFRKPRKESVA